MYTDHRPLYYRRERWQKRHYDNAIFYLPFFMRVNDVYSDRPRKLGTTLVFATNHQQEIISWTTFGGPLLYREVGQDDLFVTERIPISPLMEESRSRLGSILGSQMNV